MAHERCFSFASLCVALLFIRSEQLHKAKCKGYVSKENNLLLHSAQDQILKTELSLCAQIKQIENLFIQGNKLKVICGFSTSLVQSIAVFGIMFITTKIIKYCPLFSFFLSLSFYNKITQWQSFSRITGF